MRSLKSFLGFGLALVAVVAVVVGTVEVRAEKVVIADFNKGTPTTNLGSKFGAWDKDPADTTQSCVTSFSDTEKLGGKGKSLKITFDVDSPNPAYNGIWMQLNKFDASKYTQLVLQVKGDATEGYTSAFKVELKNATETSSFVVSGIDETWQKISIPLSEFAGLTDLSALTELVIVFDDINVTEKVGSIYVDDITFE